MSKYTTGEMAKLCGVSVRTVQFYDTKGLLPPSELTEGGRRLYTDSDLSELRLICTLKDLGCSLDSIKGVLKSELRGKVLTLLLDEQTKQLADEINIRKKQIDAIKVIKESIRTDTESPVNLTSGIDTIMKNNKEEKRLTVKMQVAGVMLGAAQWGTLMWWIFRGDWLPFAIAMPLVLIGVAIILQITKKINACICPKCNSTFWPPIRQYFFAGSSHSKVRKFTCTVCGNRDYCVEVYAKKKSVKE